MASNVRVVDTLPSGVSNANGTVTCDLASVGTANPIIINVIAPNTAGDITNLTVKRRAMCNW